VTSLRAPPYPWISDGGFECKVIKPVGVHHWFFLFEIGDACSCAPHDFKDSLWGNEAFHCVVWCGVWRVKMLCIVMMPAVHHNTLRVRDNICYRTMGTRSNAKNVNGKKDYRRGGGSGKRKQAAGSGEGAAKKNKASSAAATRVTTTADAAAAATQETAAAGAAAKETAAAGAAAKETAAKGDATPEPAAAVAAAKVAAAVEAGIARGCGEPPEPGAAVQETAAGSAGTAAAAAREAVNRVSLSPAAATAIAGGAAHDNTNGGVTVMVSCQVS